MLLEAATKTEYAMVKKLYMQAFPPDERPPFFMIRRGLRQRRAELLVAKEGGQFAGFAYTVPYADLVYLFFLAVHPDMRGRGNGGKILSLLKEKYIGKTIFLGREPLDDAAENSSERQKRRAFYMKNGFLDLPVQIKEGGVAYDVMSTGNRLTADEYDALITGWCGKFFRRFTDMQFVEKIE